MTDIARLAGVSTATVSRALSNSTLVNEETRRRVRELANSLGYKVNVSAQNLRMRNNRTVGLVIPYDKRIRQHITDPFFMAMLGSLADALTEKNFDMLLFRVDSDKLSELSDVHATGRVGGIIVIGQWGHHDDLNEIALRRVPIVIWGAQLPRQLYCSVGSDNLAGGRLATEHLLAAGRKRIVFLGDPTLAEVEQRHEGYVAALRNAGLKEDPQLLVSTPFTPEDAKLDFRAFLQRKVPFDAIFAASDLLAMTAMGLLAESGFAVPDDVSVVGYDDIEGAAHFHPPLTTIKQPLMEAGVNLVECLEIIMAGGMPDSRICPTELVVRASSVPNPKPASTRT